MPSVEWFNEQAAALRAQPGVREVTVAADNLTVFADGRSVLIDPDRDDPARVALWVGVTPPAGMAGDLIADACMAFTAEHAIATGCVMGYNEKANAVAVARSAYASEFAHHGADSAGALVATLLGAARAGDAALANARPAPPIADSEELARLRQRVPNTAEGKEMSGLVAAFDRIVGRQTDAG